VSAIDEPGTRELSITACSACGKTHAVHVRVPGSFLCPTNGIEVYVVDEPGAPITAVIDEAERAVNGITALLEKTLEKHLLAQLRSLISALNERLDTAEATLRDARATANDHAREVIDRYFAAPGEKKHCCRCGDKRVIPSVCDDPQCGDSTWDHFCDLGGVRPCPDCATPPPPEEPGR